MANWLCMKIEANNILDRIKSDQIRSSNTNLIQEFDRLETSRKLSFLIELCSNLLSLQQMPSFEVFQLKQVQIHEQINLSFSNSIAFAGCDWAVGICEAAVCANLTHMWIELHIDSPHVNKCIRKLDLRKTDDQSQRSLVHV